jgi:hypothetical protein
MPKPQQTDIFDFGKLSKGLTAVKEVWGFASRMAALQEQYAGKPVPADKFFLTMFGFGDKPNPLAFVEKQLSEINFKLDRVLVGINQLKIGQLRQETRAAHLHMKRSADLIETYFAQLVDYQGGEHPWTDAEREEFVDKLTGKWSEQDSVAFNALQVVNLNPDTGAPLFFDLFFEYLSAGATAANATPTQLYLKGAFAFRAFGETLSRALILELFAVTSAGGAPARVAARAKRVTEKYRQWLMDSTELNLLPFAEKLATYNFRDEYLGGHDTSMNAHRTRQYWRPAKPSILQSADELAARLIGKTRSVTLRVIPNVPPIVDKTPTQGRRGVVSAGRYEFEITERPKTSLTRETLLDKLESSKKNFFMMILTPNGRPSITAESVKKVDGLFAEGAAVPVGFDKRRLSFLRYQFDLSPDVPGFRFRYIINRELSLKFRAFETTWRKVYVEEGRRSPEGQEEKVEYHLMNVNYDFFPGYFGLPPEGQLSPVLVTYAYDTFGPAPGSVLHYPTPK